MLQRIPANALLTVAALLAFTVENPVEAQMHDAHSGPVMNYHRIDERLVTGGHIVDDGAASLSEQGVTVVIDLRDDSPRGERKRFAENDIQWINVPVEWRDPKPADFERFAEVMKEHSDAHVLVQCAANYRASAMTYLYRVVVEGVPEEEALADMRVIWNPDENSTWRAYIDEVKSSHAE